MDRDRKTEPGKCGQDDVFSRMATISRGICPGGHSGPADLQPVNIPDIRESKIYDFSGAMKYDRMTI
jgi:hypothetical protein